MTVRKFLVKQSFSYPSGSGLKLAKKGEVVEISTLGAKP